MPADPNAASPRSAVAANGASAFLEARDFLLSNRCDYTTAYKGFRWPKLDTFNWAVDYFDVMAAGNNRPALTITNRCAEDQTFSFAELSERSNQVANFLVQLGTGRGDRVLVTLGNDVALWEIILAALKVGFVVVPTSSAIHRGEIKDRIERGRVGYIVASGDIAERFTSVAGSTTLISVCGVAKGWMRYEEAYNQPKQFEPRCVTSGTDPLLLYFTSGTTAKPKLVLHSQHSYPVGHLSTMYWIGIMPGDLHWNISAPGWAKHAWSSFFAPWNAGACILASNEPRFSAAAALDTLVQKRVSTLCAPPTAWRMIVKEDLR